MQSILRFGFHRNGRPAPWSNRVRDVGRLHLKSARELAEYALSDNPLESSLGVAAINSLLDVDEIARRRGQRCRGVGRTGRGKNVALVGHFPFVPKLREKLGKLWVIEQRPVRRRLPRRGRCRADPQADVVALTGSALINHTLDGLLALCAAARW